jgi:hypothetical protein
MQVGLGQAEIRGDLELDVPERLGDGEGARADLDRLVVLAQLPQAGRHRGADPAQASPIAEGLG